MAPSGPSRRVLRISLLAMTKPNNFPRRDKSKDERGVRGPQLLVLRNHLFWFPFCYGGTPSIIHVHRIFHGKNSFLGVFVFFLESSIFSSDDPRKLKMMLNTFHLGLYVYR